MNDFDLQCFMTYIELLKQYNRSNNKKEKEILKEKMEALRHGLIPISTSKKQKKY